MSVGVSRSGAGCCRSPVYRPLRTFHSSSPQSWSAAQPLPDSVGALPMVDSELGHNLIKTKQIINNLLINIWAKGESVRPTNLNNSEVRIKKSKRTNISNLSTKCTFKNPTSMVLVLNFH